MLEKDTGIILNSRNFAEADRIVTVLFRKHGRMNLVFKGVKKSKSRKLNSAELGNAADFLFYRKNGRQPPYLKEISVRNHFQKIKKEYARYLYLNLICELFMAVSPPEESNVKLFNFLLNILFELKKTPLEGLPVFIMYIEFRLLQLAGVMPDPVRCSRCHDPSFELEYSLLLNEFFCARCRRQAEGILLPFSRELASLLGRLDRLSIKSIARLNVPGRCFAPLEQTLHNMIVHYVNREIRSRRIVTQMVPYEHTGCC